MFLKFLVLNTLVEVVAAKIVSVLDGLSLGQGLIGVYAIIAGQDLVGDAIRYPRMLEAGVEDALLIAVQVLIFVDEY